MKSVDHDHVVRITGPAIAFPVVDEKNGGFGQIVVRLEPGAQETITIRGHVITVMRDPRPVVAAATEEL